MTMRAYRISLRSLTAFGTALAGDTVFGQLCWTLHQLHGQARLAALLDGYTDGAPFLVVSDAFPAGLVPLPALPAQFWAVDGVPTTTPCRSRRWLPAEHVGGAPQAWLSHARGDELADSALGGEDGSTAFCMHASVARGSVDTREHAGQHRSDQLHFHPQARHELYLVLDEARLALAELRAALEHIGATGYGRDASAGLGKFCLVSEPVAMAHVAPPGANAWLTLGPVAPQGQGFCPHNSSYRSTTRFGRHGSYAALGPHAFKKPVLLARSGAVFTPKTGFDATRLFIGQGLGGVSHAQAHAVHQGYAPVMAVRLPAERFGPRS
jgi:CRISPR-associated protein Csm4